MGGFSSQSPYNSSKIFTLHFMDCIENAEIIPLEGNTIITKYEAYFRVPKFINTINKPCNEAK
jgi:hypothetical protein